MIKVGIYYIATGVYKSWFPGFLSSLENFMPKAEKHLVIISDGLDSYQGYHDVATQICVDKVFHIIDYPWPIVTLFKMKYILDNYNPNYKYIFYFNGNSEILPKSVCFWDNFSNCLEENDMVVTYQGTNPAKEDKSQFKKGNRLYDIKGSTSYIGTTDYYYVQACFFGGKAEAVYAMCQEHLEMVAQDLKRHIIAPYDDETYFNKYVYEHKNSLKIKYLLAVYGEEFGFIPKYEEQLFIKLRYNEQYKCKKHTPPVSQHNQIYVFLSKLYHSIIK